MKTLSICINRMAFHLLIVNILRQKSLFSHYVGWAKSANWMGQSPSWEPSTGSYSFTQYISSLLCSLKFDNHVHRILSVVPVLNLMNSVSTLLLSFFKIFIILSFHLCQGLPSGFYPSGFPSKTLYAVVISTCMLHSCPSCLIWSSRYFLVISCCVWFIAWYRGCWHKH